MQAAPYGAGYAPAAPASAIGSTTGHIHAPIVSAVPLNTQTSAFGPSTTIGALPPGPLSTF
ncbi:MAG: hypothetical protein ACKOJF_32250 [Planctomycetaceae bacterium]